MTGSRAPQPLTVESKYAVTMSITRMFHSSLFINRTKGNGAISVANANVIYRIMGTGPNVPP